MQIPIGQNRKRGRPNKTKKALVRQNENNSLSQYGLMCINNTCSCYPVSTYNGSSCGKLNLNIFISLKLYLIDLSNGLFQWFL